MLLALAAAPAAVAEPARVVSANLCADQLVLRLLPRERIASVTWLAADPESSGVAGLAHGLPVNHSRAEELLRDRHAVAVVSTYTPRNVIDLLRSQGRGVIELPSPSTLADAREQILDLADRLGVEEEGVRIVNELDARLAGHEEVPLAERRTALVLGPNGFGVGGEPLLNEAMARAGLRNLAGELSRGGAVPLEVALASKVDVLVLDDARRGAAKANELLDHPAVRALQQSAVVARLPSRLWICGGPQIADAVDILAEARRRVPQ